MTLDFSYKLKAYRIELPENWEQCSKKDIRHIINCFIVTELSLCDGVRKFLRARYKLPKKVIAKIERLDLILKALDFIESEPFSAKEVLPERVIYAKSPGPNLNRITIRDYFLAQMLVSQITEQLLDRNELNAKKLRELSSIIYKKHGGWWSKRDSFWVKMAHLVSKKKAYYAYITFTACMRRIRLIYPTMHSGGTNDDGTLSITEVHNMLNNVSGPKFGTRHEAELYTIHEVFPYLESMAEKNQKAEREAALRKLKK